MTKHRLPARLSNEDLLVRAIALSDRYLVGTRPSSVRWVTNQTARWGSCSYYSGDIRVSHRLRAVPEWVLDSVLVHEVAHLSIPTTPPTSTASPPGTRATTRQRCSWPATASACPGRPRPEPRVAKAGAPRRAALSLGLS